MGVSTVQSTSCFIIIVWVIFSAHCLAGLHLGAGVEQPIDYLIIQNRQVVQSMGKSMDWTLKDNMVNGLTWYSARHSQFAEAAILHLCKQEWKCLTLVRRVLIRTHAVLGRSRRAGADVGDESTGSHSAIQPFVISSVPRPERHTSVIVVRWTDELLCSGYKWMSNFERPAFPLCGQVSAEWSRCPCSMARRAGDSVAPLRDALQVGCLREQEDCPLV